MVFEPLELIEKLAALVPPPRFNLVRYHGVLAPGSRYRRLVVPQGTDTGVTGDSGHPGCPARSSKRAKLPLDGGCRKQGSGSRPRNYSWAELMRRVFAIDVLECPACGGRMRVLCAIHPPEAIRKILDCLGLPSRPPPIASAALEDDADEQQIS